MSIQEIKGILLEIRKLESIESVLHWDQETYMPEGSGDIRAEHIAYVSYLAHSKHTSKRIDSGRIRTPMVAETKRRTI